MTRAVACFAITLLCCMPTTRGSKRVCLRSAAEDHFRLGLAGDVSSISIGAFVWRCGSIDCPTASGSCSLDAPYGLLSGTLPDAIGRLSCRSQITSMYAPQPWRSQSGPRPHPYAVASMRLGTGKAPRSYSTLPVRLPTPPPPPVLCEWSLAADILHPAWSAACLQASPRSPRSRSCAHRRPLAAAACAG
jgi:hypothetical protein